MEKLFIDIETIPTQKPGFLDEIMGTIAPPGNITKQESKDKWMAENADQAAKEKYLKTSFDGTHGEIVCIGWAVDDASPQTVFRTLGQSETTLLIDFYEIIKEELQFCPVYIGHNVLNFDLRFLYHRSVINAIKPPFLLRQDTRYNGEFVFDTMLAWAGWGNRISLKNLCAALDVPVKSNGLDGSKVWDYVQEGRMDEVAEYCREDVAATREVYRKMTFGGMM